ncbi:LOW QUALITY PROTEIN: hypothetical protein PHMEG_0007341 [Phytophthora megakarya]|uniref:Eukaryotic/viral aspartic protease n=1 Tax=Phytophthora megakarya TaxID=4795 RepID=A0A225WNG5_9STRA|nr:LOW QUALITY PROTEIN: hypothetical protein PHMEG_0007341 [Phytophthora megakarya]
MEKSTWVRLFEPKTIRQGVWADMSHELALAVTATTTAQVADDTIHPVEAPQSVLDKRVPTEAGADLWKWKHKLRTGFGADIYYSQPPTTKTAGRGDDPTKIPPSKTPQKGENALTKARQGVFSKNGDESPDFQGSHMATPKPSAMKEQQDHSSGRACATRSTLRRSRRTRKGQRSSVADSSSPEEEDDNREYPRRDAVLDGYIHQIERASLAEGNNATPKLELAMHRPLGHIQVFSGHRNKSENSIQWLRGFVYEMKGTRADPDEWCMAFQLSLKDDDLHWYRQLTNKTKQSSQQSIHEYYFVQFNQTAETRYYSAKREGEEHLNAGIQFDNGGRKARDQVKTFLETCGDRGLERRLYHIRVSDIHKLEDMIVEILRIDERNTTKNARRRNLKVMTLLAIGATRSREMVSVEVIDVTRIMADVEMILEICHASHSPKAQNPANNMTQIQVIATMLMMLSMDITTMTTMTESRYTDDEDTGSEYSVEEGNVVAAANESKRRQEVERTYARSDNKVTKNEFPPGFNRDNRFQGLFNWNRGPPRKQHGPCEACGDMFHSTHFCRHRCKLCKQVHDSGSSGNRKPHFTLRQTFKLGSTLTETRLTPNGLSLLADPAIDAECAYANAGTSKWLKNERDDNVHSTVLEKERGKTLSGGVAVEREDDYTLDAGNWVSSVVQPSSQRKFVDEIRLLPGERLGWWSAQMSTDELECKHW